MRGITGCDNYFVIAFGKIVGNYEDKKTKKQTNARKENILIPETSVNKSIKKVWKDWRNVYCKLLSKLNCGNEKRNHTLEKEMDLS